MADGEMDVFKTSDRYGKELWFPNILIIRFIDSKNLKMF